MKSHTKEFGIIGLGRMGGNLAKQALEKGYRVVGFTPEGASPNLIQSGIVEVASLESFRFELSPPRVLLVYIPAGPAIDTLIDELTPVLESGDILADGGNSYWGDSIRRHQRLKERNIHFVDLGTSGGIDGARSGACFMAGGNQEAVVKLEPILRALAVKDGFVYAGPAGSGHFVKLVHNGIEFAMLQAIAEGIDLLEHFPTRLPTADILKCWRHGSVIRSWLIDLMEAAYRSENGLDKTPAYVEDTGEVNWLVTDAIQMEVSVPVIAQAVMQLINSRDLRKNWARAIAMMRHGFGGHPYGPDETIRKERNQGRIGAIVLNQ